MNGPAQSIVVVDLRIPFFRLVFFFVKATLAAIPAAIIVGAMIMAVAVVIGAVWKIGDIAGMMGRFGL